jgi:hypothetical protein
MVRGFQCFSGVCSGVVDFKERHLDLVLLVLVHVHCGGCLQLTS